MQPKKNSKSVLILLSTFFILSMGALVSISMAIAETGDSTGVFQSADGAGATAVIPTGGNTSPGKSAPPETMTSRTFVSAIADLNDRANDTDMSDDEYLEEYTKLEQKYRRSKKAVKAQRPQSGGKVTTRDAHIAVGSIPAQSPAPVVVMEGM